MVQLRHAVVTTDPLPFPPCAISQQPSLPLPRKLIAVTRGPSFKTARKMMSRRPVIAGPVSTKKTIIEDWKDLFPGAVVGVH